MKLGFQPSLLPPDLAALLSPVLPFVCFLCLTLAIRFRKDCASLALYFHTLTNAFSRNSFPLKALRTPQGVGTPTSFHEDKNEPTNS